MRRIPGTVTVLTIGLVVIYGCGGGSSPGPVSSAPTAPTAPTTPAAPVYAWSAAGTVTTLDSGSPVANATLTPSWSLAPVTTDASGNYLLGDLNNPPQMPYAVSLTADGMLGHKVWIQWARAARTGVNIGLIHNAAPFNLTFYQQFARGTYDEPGAPWPLERWTTAPSFYIRTLDQVGAPIGQPVLDVIVDAINRAVPAYTGGLYTAVAIVMGTDVRPQTPNWINIDIKKGDANSPECGDSFVGENPGQINLYEDVCSCARIPGDVVVHEVGHAMGFFHVADTASVMYPYHQEACPDPGTPSGLELFHARMAYSRPRGNTDPDDDPDYAQVLRVGPHIRVR